MLMSHTWTKRLLILGVYIPIYGTPSLRPWSPIIWVFALRAFWVGAGFWSVAGSLETRLIMWVTVPNLVAVRQTMRAWVEGPHIWEFWAPPLGWGVIANVGKGVLKHAFFHVLNLKTIAQWQWQWYYLHSCGQKDG